MNIVDVWAQITTERMAKRPWLETLMRWTGRSGELLLPNVESTLDAMDEGGGEPDPRTMELLRLTSPRNTSF